MLFTWCPANVVVSSILGLPLALKKDLEFKKVIYTLAIENVCVQSNDDIDNVLREREKYCQTQLFMLSHRLNNHNEWYSLNKRGYRKWYFYWFIIFLNLIKSICLYLILKCINEIIVFKLIFEVMWFCLLVFHYSVIKDASLKA